MEEKGSNFSALVLQHAQQRPDRLALVIPPEVSGADVVQEVTYGQLADRVEAFRRGLEDAGFVPGDRIVVVFPVSVDLYALVLAIFAAGMVAVLVDMGMGLRRVLWAIEDSRAVAMVSVHRLLRWHALLPTLWPLRLVVADHPGGLGLRPLDALRRAGPRRPALERAPDDHALITFTSGSTGRPKGADRTHGLLTAQHLALAEHFPHRDDDIDCPCFPVVVLHDLCCGLTAVLPAVDLRAPGQVEPERVLQQLRARRATRLTAAPAFMERLAAHMLTHDVRLPEVNSLFVGGGPVSRALCAQLTQAFPGADAQVVYGSTEAEPMTSASMVEVRDEGGDGFLVGRPAEVAEIAVVQIDTPAPRLGPEGIAPWVVPVGALGEIVVRGPHVNQRYVDNPEADAVNKIRAEAGSVWHRTGDVGRWDERGRLWLHGRTKDAVSNDGRLHQPLAVEQACDALDGVRRVALIQHPRAALLAVDFGDRGPEVDAALRRTLERFGLAGVAVHPVPFIPTDRRHNTKIDRPALRAYVTATWWGDALPC